MIWLNIWIDLVENMDQQRDYVISGMNFLVP